MEEQLIKTVREALDINIGYEEYRNRTKAISQWLTDGVVTPWIADWFCLYLDYLGNLAKKQRMELLLSIAFDLAKAD